MGRIHITITRHASDGFTLSTIIGNRYLKMRYIGYPMREARKRFRAYVKSAVKNPTG